MAPKVSIIIPTHNRAGKIVHALDSVKTQTLKDIETIVVDDASTDNTRQVVEEYARQNPDILIRYIRHPQNQNVSPARNTGIEAATGEYVAFLDSDDYWRSKKLALQVEAMEKLPASERWACYCHYDNILKDSGVVGAPFAPVNGQQLAADILNGLSFNMGSTLLIRRDLLLKEEMFFDPHLTSAEDWEWNIRFALKGGQFIVVPEKLSVYMNEVSKLYPNSRAMIAHVYNKHSQDAYEKLGFGGWFKFKLGIDKQYTAIDRGEGHYMKAAFRYAWISLRNPRAAIRYGTSFVRRRLGFLRGSAPGSNPEP